MGYHNAPHHVHNADDRVRSTHQTQPAPLDLKEETTLQQGGQIISPRHWDRRQMAYSAGHSPLDVAALGCREYHGYQRGYYPLTPAIISRCGYRDAQGGPSPYCNDIVLLHRRVMDSWENPRYQQYGPSVDRILEKGIPVFPKLDVLDMAAMVNFYDKLQKTSAIFLLPLTLFDAIKLNMGFEGLCPPGLGLPRYAEIAGVLMEVLPRLLPDTDSQITLLITVVRAESNNGYDLLWRILELVVPGFDPSLQLSTPIWMGDDIFDFCLAFVLYFRLQAKRGLIHDERTKSITFLHAVREPAYADVITTLLAHIDTYLSNQDFGYLPPNLCMMGLAGQMNKNNRARVQEVLPRMVRSIAWHPDEWHPATPEIQGFHTPQVSRTTYPQYGSSGDTRTSPRVPAHQGDRNNRTHDDRLVTPCPSVRDTGRGQHTTSHSRGRYARPDHNRRPYDPDVTCAACKRRGHLATNCDMLAMALFLEKYNKLLTRTDRDKIESAWLARWKENLGNPTRMPRKVMRAYLDHMDISEDTLDHQMDWDSWPVDDDMDDIHNNNSDE